MGTDYYLIPTSIVGQYPWVLDALNLYSMGWLNTSEVGRNPSPVELRAVLDELSDYDVQYSVSENNWQADIRARRGIPLFRPTSLLCVVDYTGDESESHLVCLESGDMYLNLLIAERLSRTCGPLLIIPDTGTLPLLVTPGSDPTELIRNWGI
jgi:hypothetical protein